MEIKIVMNRFYYMALAAALTAGCAKEASDNVAAGQGEETLVSLCFKANLPVAETKTVISQEDGYRMVSWGEGDSVMILWDGGSVEADVDSEGGISAEVGESDTYIAVYPLLDASLDGSRVTVDIPAEQDGSFASANVMAAVTSVQEREFNFCNASGIFSFDVLRDDITMVILRSNDGAPVAGKETLVFDESGKISDVEYSGEMSAEISVQVSGKGTYYVSVLKDAVLAAGIGMRYLVGDDPLPGVLSVAPLVADDSSLYRLGCPEAHINMGDYYIKAGGAGDGSCWDNAGGEELLRSLLNANVAENVMMDGVTLGWRNAGKTIHVAAGVYNLNRDGLPVVIRSTLAEGIVIMAGYPGDSAGTEPGERDPSANETRFTVTSGAICQIDSTACDLTFDGVFFYAGTSAGTGGAVSCNTGSSVTFNGCTFKDCSAAYGGGAVYIASGDVHFNGCLFDGNEAGKGTDVWNYSYSGGGLMMAGETSRAYLDRCIFKGNKAHSSGDLQINTGASCFVNRCSFHEAHSIQSKSESQWYGRSMTLDDLATGKFPTLRMHNSTVTKSSSVYASYAGLPVITPLSANVLVSSTSVCDSAVGLIKYNKNSASSYSKDFHVYNNLFVNSGNTFAAINLHYSGGRDGYCNIMEAGNTYWSPLDGNDIRVGHEDINLEWNAAEGYYTWTLNVDASLVAPLAEQAVLEQKVAAAAPDFDEWLRSIESNPYGIDQAGNLRNGQRMTPGSWESSLF